MKTPEFWRRITQALPELLLDSSALGKSIDNIDLFVQWRSPCLSLSRSVWRFGAVLSELQRQTSDRNGSSQSTVVQGGRSSDQRMDIEQWQYLSRWTVITWWGFGLNEIVDRTFSFDLAAYFLNGSPHLVEQMAPRQPAVNVMPRRITNEDFLRALEQTNRSNAAATTEPTTAPPPTPPAPRSSSRRNVISMDQLRSVLQRSSAPVTTMENTSNEPAHVQALLDQMRAMGLTDEAANRQALEATQWDLKAALDLLLG